MSAPPPLAGVIGWPIGHSRSPALHGHWLRRHGIAGAYLALPVAPERFETVLRAMPHMGFRGANVTLPHKEAALALADEASPRARRIGAANTLVFDGETGAIHADNTDGFGFVENLRAARPDWRAGDGPALILGAGGAARGIVVGLLDAGATEIRLANRTRARAEALAADIGEAVTVIDWAEAEAAMDGAGLIANTTSLGMTGQPPLDLRLDAAMPEALATDAVYAPLITPFLARAEARGLAVVDGLGMLLHQARPGFEAWFGAAPVVDAALRDAVLAS